MPEPKEGMKRIFVAASYEDGLAYAGTEVNQRHLEAINMMQRKKKKKEMSADEVIVRPIRLSGTKVTSIATRFYEQDLYKLAEQVPGSPLLMGHNYESAPLGTFYMAEVTRDGEDAWLDGWFYVLNDEEGRALIDRIDKGVFNESSITWTYTDAVCSICGRDYFGSPDENGETCQHWRGREYDGQLCYIYTTGDVEFIEGSIVFRGAHPGTKVGGDFLEAAASASGGITQDKAEERKKMLIEKASIAADEEKQEQAAEPEVEQSAEQPEEKAAEPEQEERSYVPPNPSDYSLDEDAGWSRPNYSDFVAKMNVDEGTSWEDLSDAQRKWIASHFAWAPSSSTSSYTFTDLKLPHHLPDTYPKSVLKWGGVKAAAQRLPTSDIPEGDMAAVRRHLAAHYHEFDRTAPWEEDSSAWDEYADVMGKVARGFITNELLERAKLLADELFGEKEEVSDMVDFELKLGEETVTFSGEAEVVAEQLQAAIDEMVEKMAEKLRQVEAAAQQTQEELDMKAKLGEAYIKDLVEEIERLAIAVDGADAIDGYKKAIEVLAQSADVESLKAERERLSKKLEKIPNERLSKDVLDGQGEGPVGSIPPKELDAFKQH